MNFLLIGDIFAKPGRKFLEENLAKIQKQYQVDFTIANGENITHGNHISKNHFLFLKSLNVDVVTSGNHIFDHKSTLEFINQYPTLLRPLNMYHNLPGKGYVVVTKNNKKILVTNIIGKAFMPHANNFYRPFTKLLKQFKNQKIDIHIVDFHGEATAEKKAFAYNFDGQVTCVFGTHTHVQTADNQILAGGSAYITDLGMTGSYHSIIGANPKEVIYKEKTNLRTRFVPSNKKAQFNACLLQVDEITNKAVALTRIYLVPKENV